MRAVRWSLLMGVGLVLALGAPLAEEVSRYPVMRPDPATWAEWMEALEAAPPAYIDPAIAEHLAWSKSLNLETSMSLLGHLDYDPVQRNQGGCGNCWVWAGTGVMEIAHHVKNSVFDRLSIQYFDSCEGGWACCGGNLGAFATWYSGEGRALPWDNTNAAFADGALGCAAGASGVSCASIGTIPSYPIISIAEQSIPIHDISQADAIANIKNVLNQNRAIYFSFALPDGAAWDDFFDFWDGVAGETEATLWPDTDSYCGQEWNEAPNEAGGHAVLIVGYNDDDPNPANHYWLAVNSWSTAWGVRPSGLFRIPTHMNYDCVYPDANNNRSFWTYGFLTLDIEFGDALPVADAGGPYVTDCQGITTSVQLDGTASMDLEGPVTYAWTTDCPGGSFGDATAAEPWLTLGSSPGCDVNCTAFLTVTDTAGQTDGDNATITVEDIYPPTLTCAADVTVECDESTLPGYTGLTTATDVCDPMPMVDFMDAMAPGSCPQESTITRTWTATDVCDKDDFCEQTIEVVDTTEPVVVCPPDVVVECDQPTDPSATGTATVTDNCDMGVTVSHSDVTTPGSCPQEYTITRTWSSTDSCGNQGSCVQMIEVVDTTAPVIACNAPLTITPPDAPISFTATAMDNCDGDPMVQVLGYDCYKLTANGKRISKLYSCVASFDGATFLILDSGGVDDNIDWEVEAVDACGNRRTALCHVEVVNPTTP